MERSSASRSDRIVINTTRISTVICQLFDQWCVRSLVCICSSIELCLILMKNSLNQPFLLDCIDTRINAIYGRGDTTPSI